MSARFESSSTGLIPEIHSQTAREIPREDTNDILRISAYHRKDFDLAVIWFPQATHSDVFPPTKLVPSKSTTTLGALDNLPLEIVNKICLALDVASLFRFRQVNTRARQIVDELHQYRTILTHAINTFCALLRTGLASNITLSNFYRLLCSQSCSVCGSQHGYLVHLPLWIRCCSHCLRSNSPEIQVATLTAVKRVLKLSKKTLLQLPSFKTLPGVYSMDQRPRLKRMTVVPIKTALSAYSAEHGGVEAPQALLDQLDTPAILAFMSCCAMPSFDVRTGESQNGVCCAGCQLALEESLCTRAMTEADKAQDVVYSHDGFLEHFKGCEQAKALWDESDCGTRQPAKLPYFCQIGGYIKRVL